MNSTDALRGRVALCVAHCAGLVDLVALPLWVGALIQHHQLDPQQAGLLVTLFLVGGVLASLVVAPLFHRLRQGRWLVAVGFVAAALVFHLVASARGLGVLAGLHGLGGLAIGTALSVTHGCVARSTNPHRLFALCGTAQGVFALAFLASLPPLMAQVGAPVVFEVFAGVMLLGAVVSALAFPSTPALGVATASPASGPAPAPAVPAAEGALSTGLWGGILGLCAMSMVQSMSFGFLERVGMDRGYGVAAVTAVLAALGFVNLFPTAVAAWLEKRVAPHRVLLLGPVVQAGLAWTIFNAEGYLAYALASSMLVATILFTHVFGFGLMARLDRSGRAMAATPAMMMTGAAIGPVLGGTLVKSLGYGALGWAAVVMAVLAVACFSRLPKRVPVTSPAGTVAHSVTTGSQG